MTDESIIENDHYKAAQISYIIESIIYALAMLLGIAACYYTLHRFRSHYRRNLVFAARLVKFKINLMIADLIVLYVYAPVQIIWIITYNWYGGDFLCRLTKFINTFSLHLTANMQVLIAADRLYITAHLRQIHQMSHFATNQMIALAWILAITCAFPQLFVFHVYILPDSKPQCVSVWTVINFREYLQQKAEQIHNVEQTTGDWNFNGYNITLTKDFDFMNSTAEILFLNNDILKALEYAYNALHLFSIYIVPYLIELLCYTLMLILMKQFHNDNDVKKNQRGRCCCFKRTNISRNCTSKSSLSINFSTGDSLRFWDANVGITDGITTDIGNKSNRIRKYRFWMSLLKHFNERTDETLTLEEKKRQRSSVAWKSTVALARRKTRRKAFLMLTLNMIFWTPYCVIGILSAIMEFDHSSYDFLNALVVLNAVSNLLL